LDCWLGGRSDANNLRGREGEVDVSDLDITDAEYAEAILQSVADTLGIPPEMIPAEARRVANRSCVRQRIREIEATQRMTAKDFQIVIT